MSKDIYSVNNSEGPTLSRPSLWVDFSGAECEIVYIYYTCVIQHMWYITHICMCVYTCKHTSVHALISLLYFTKHIFKIQGVSAISKSEKRA